MKVKSVLYVFESGVAVEFNSNASFAFLAQVVADCIAMEGEIIDIQWA